MPGKPRRRRCPGCHSWICWHMVRCWPCQYREWAARYGPNYMKVWEDKPSSYHEKKHPCSCGYFTSDSGEANHRDRFLDCYRLEQVGYTGLRASDLCPVCLGGAIADPCQPSHRR